MRTIWDKIVNWLLGIDAKLRVNFAGGALVAAFFAVALNMRLCFWPVIFVSGFKEFFLDWTDKSTGRFRWTHFAAALVGALVVQVFVLLNMWWL